MEKNIKREAHCVYTINYHLVWIARYRRQVRIGVVAERLRALCGEMATPYGFEILTSAVLPDPVYLFVSVPPQYAPAQVVRLFQGSTSRRLKQEFPQIRQAYWGAHATLWAEGYYVGTAGHVSAATIRRYSEGSQKV
jgi:putative transposase